MRERRAWAALLAVTLVAFMGSACASGHAGFRLGREPQGVQWAVYVRGVIERCTKPGVSDEAADACAIARLVEAKGMSREEAASAVLDARVAGGGR